ncbi:unnamed protein product [Paramecium sonneborni]|uniref:RING-type domain-containing protein n=1 Tax=Paramecium sonneborni TaxID=65129 RepID=A0A8S1NW10_9CILI|nr:unnamed protein product [Paramecium sonneborni]
MQQVAPEEQEINQQIMSNIQLQNQIDQSDLLIQQALRTNQIIIVFKSLRNEAIFQLIISFLELFLLILALGLLPSTCKKTTIPELFISALVTNALQAFQMLYLLLIIYYDLVKINRNQSENQLPYSEYSYCNKKYLSDAISDYHGCYKFTKYMTFILDCVVFLFGQVEFYKNLYGECEIGNSEFEFTWGVAFTFLIMRYIRIGIPILIIVIYLIILPFVYCCNRHNLKKQNIFGASQENIGKLKVEMVGQDKISEDNECVICLQEFIEGEQFVRLDCHSDHVYHKLCISDWLKARSECPKCRQHVKFE